MCLALTAQVVLAALISLAAGPVRLQWLWIAFLVSITTGKAVWVSACPQERTTMFACVCNGMRACWNAEGGRAIPPPKSRGGKKNRRSSDTSTEIKSVQRRCCTFRGICTQYGTSSQPSPTEYGCIMSPRPHPFTNHPRNPPPAKPLVPPPPPWWSVVGPTCLTLLLPPTPPQPRLPLPPPPPPRLPPPLPAQRHELVRLRVAERQRQKNYLPPKL